MAKAETKAPKVLIGNRLRDGLVVYLTPRGGWSERIAEARVEEGDGVEALSAAGAAADAACIVVGPELIDVTRDETGTPRPLRYREFIRAMGPSVRPDLGKQAEGHGLDNA